MTKKCRHCGQAKDVSEFSGNSRMPDGRQALCRPCLSTATRRRYEANPSIRSKVLARKKANVDANRQRVAAYLREHPCTRCRETDINVLNFVRRDEEKLGRIGTLLKDNSGWTKIEAEIAMCDVVCLNCRARRGKRATWG